MKTAFGPMTRQVLLLRAIPFALVVLSGATLLAIRPTGLVAMFVVVGALAAVSAVAWPGAGNTAALVATAAAYATAVTALSPSARIVVSVPTAVALYAVHLSSAVASNVPASSTVDREVVAAALDHLALVCVVAAPTMLVAEQVAQISGSVTFLRVAAVIAAFALTLVPLLLAHRSRGRIS